MSNYWPESYFSPTTARTGIEETNIFLVNDDLLSEALDWVSGCENCNTEAVHSFDYVLDATTGADPTSTEYLLFRPAMCPECNGHITEKTRVRIG